MDDEKWINKNALGQYPNALIVGNLILAIHINNIGARMDSFHKLLHIAFWNGHTTCCRASVADMKEKG